MMTRNASPPRAVPCHWCTYCLCLTVTPGVREGKRGSWVGEVPTVVQHAVGLIVVAPGGTAAGEKHVD